VFYTRILDRAVDDFAALQQVYDTYFAALKTNTSTVDQVRAARLQHNQIILTAKEQNVELARIAEATAGIINGYQTVLPALQTALQGQLDALGDAIERNRDFNLRTVLQCLTTLAFAPESKFMMIVQGSTLLYDRFNTVTSVQGVPVEKDYIVKQLVGIEASVSGLEEGFCQLRNGTLEPQDPGAGKLIAEETAFLQFMSQFDASFPEELASVKDAFDAYVSSIVRRNNELLTYNSALQLISRNEEAITTAQSRMKALDDETLDTLSPQLPDLVSYVSGIYYASRNQVLATLDQAARAYRFWALSNRNLMIESLGDKAPPQINAATLLGAKNTILKAYEQAVETFGTGAESFPVKGKGLVIEIPSEDLEDFRKSGLLFVRPKTVRQTTSKADSVFAAMANVRVNSVRVWIDGATASDGDITVSITHTGKEEIVAPNGNMYSFAHSPVTKLFKYHTNYDTGQRTIQEEANFGLLQQIGDGQQIYAAIGPFTSWFIQVRTQNHVKLNLRKTTAVQIEFSGSNYAFNTSR